VEQHLKERAAGQVSQELIDSLKVNPPENCGACHY
jgi:hypothetical protein